MYLLPRSLYTIYQCIRTNTYICGILFLIDFSSCDGKAIVSMIANALCHARFYGENPASDEVSLMKILQVLRTLLLSNYGTLLTDENVWEIMKACVNICFVNSLSGKQ